MKRGKFLLLAITVALAVMVVAPMVVQASPELGQTIVFVQVPDDWEAPALWAWGSATGGLWDHLGWPGQPMMEDPNNPGWYFQWMPADMTGGLVNANEGTIQTGDIDLEGQPVWITVSGAGDDFTVTTEQQTTGDFPSGTTALFAYVPDGWEAPHVWAWGGAESALFETWPGTAAMRNVPGNPGWYFFHVPGDMTGGLISANDGTIQISDLALEGQPVWVTIEDAGDAFTVTNEPQTTGPIPQMYTIMFVEVPDGWDAPGVWAWGSVTGDLWADWPGEPMTQDPNNPGWYFQWIPTDMTGALINANGGDIQTSDFDLDGRPVWVTVSGEGDGRVTTDEAQTTGIFPPFAATAPVPAAAEGMVEVEAVVVYAQIPEGWENPSFWGWGGSWSSFYEGEWPGPVMSPDSDNPGWYYIFLPANVTGIIVNANEGEAQTSDISFEGSPIWIVIHDYDGNFDIHSDQQTEGAIRTSEPFLFGEEEEADRPDVGYITVRAFVPDSWENPGVWAWNDDYGSVFAGWPGQPFEERDGPWYVMQLPAWIDNIIINAAGVQTEDMEVEMGQDIWILVHGYRHSYAFHEPFDPDDVEEPEREEIVFGPAPTDDEDEEDEPAAEADEDDDGGAPVVIIIVIIAAVVAAVGACLFVILKKKKSGDAPNKN